MMPEAGGMYVYLREAFSPLLGFLYGWTLLTVIQTGTIAAVAIAFARFSGVMFPAIREDQYLIAPVHVLPGYALSLSTAQLLAIVIIVLITRLQQLWGEVGQADPEHLHGRQAGRHGGAAGAGRRGRVSTSGGAARQLRCAVAPGECDADSWTGGDDRLRAVRRAVRLADGLALLRGFLA